MNLWTLFLNFLVKPQRGAERAYVPIRQAGVTVTEDTALTFSAVWACVSVISRTISALPWGVYEKTDSGRREIDGKLSWLLNNQPNPEMTAMSFREVMMVHALLWGNAYAEISRDLAGRPSALWPIPPDTVCLERDAVGNLEYVVRHDKGNTRLAATNILHLHGMGFDGLQGYSPIRQAARSIGMGIAQDTFGQAFYANGTVFGSLLEMPGNMSSDQIKQAEKYMNDRLRGPDKAFSVKVAPAGVKVHGMSMPMTDAQFLESRKFSVTEICRWYGVPPHKVADLDRSTNNNIEHQGIEFVADAIVPWAVRLEQEVSTKLIGSRSQGRTYTKLAVNALMRGDAASRANFYKAMTQMGAMSINEVRALEELNGIGPDGDSLLVQLNQTTLEYLVENPGVKASASKPTASGEPMQADGEDGGTTVAQSPQNVSYAWQARRQA
jgi:HK97 family phage portal protein